MYFEFDNSWNLFQKCISLYKINVLTLETSCVVFYSFSRGLNCVTEGNI